MSLLCTFSVENSCSIKRKLLHVSRFNALAPFRNQIKLKYLYDFSINLKIKTHKTELSKQPEDIISYLLEKVLQEESLKSVTVFSFNNYRWGKQTHKNGNKKRLND